ncbi:MAG: rhodanese-like domain-containing protein [Deltaproteobacteria bacterium]|nr:rhodanese-like domain-containing protein [Deltaproteobacteria bacterium]
MTVRRVSPQEAFELLEEGHVHVDVRSVTEFENGHPAGAYNLPLLNSSPHGMQPNADFVRVFVAVFPKDTKLVLGCRSGGRSLRAAHMLLREGYTTVVDQRAGFSGAGGPFGQVVEAGWQAAGLPVAHEALEGRSYAELEARVKEQ